jgi:hypothetical protein
MSKPAHALDYDSPAPGVEHFDGGVRITLPPSPTAVLVFQWVEVLAGVLVCCCVFLVLFLVLMPLRGGSLKIPAFCLQMTLVTLLCFGSFFIDRRRQRVIEAAHGMLSLSPGTTHRFPLSTVMSVRAARCWSIVPPVRRTCLRVHFRTGASLKLLDEVDTPDVLRLAELLDEIVQAGLRLPNPDTELESSVAALRRPESGI